MLDLLYTNGRDTLLVDTRSDAYLDALSLLCRFSHLRVQAGSLHTYKISQESLWQASSLGLTPEIILRFLRSSTSDPLPYAMQVWIADSMNRYGKLTLERHSESTIRLQFGENASALAKLVAQTKLTSWQPKRTTNAYHFPASARADIKRSLSIIGYPVIDLIGYDEAPSVDIQLRKDVKLRDYQREAIGKFLHGPSPGSGVVVLPCGSGKTYVGIGSICELKRRTLIVTPNLSSSKQWLRELEASTIYEPGTCRIYQNQHAVSPITIVTYSRIISKTRDGKHLHLESLANRSYGLVIYDEVHMLPAPLFRLAADLQGSRRLGLTATLVREDGNEAIVQSLVGPLCYQLPWRTLEAHGDIANVRCVEVRIPFSNADTQTYIAAKKGDRHKLAANNRQKLPIVELLLARHPQEGILIMSHYLDILRELGQMLKIPLITGESTEQVREAAWQAFREGRMRCLALSRIGNLAIDVPRASVAIQISGLFGSRQEEAQRLGRLLRPEGKNGTFYSLVTEKSVEEEMAHNRQRFLVEQGYQYEVVSGYDILREGLKADEAHRMSEFI